VIEPGGLMVDFCRDDRNHLAAMKPSSSGKFPGVFAWMLPVLVFGVLARFWIGRFGVNFDFDSYRIVVDLMQHGQNVYAGTTRYNYGPVWFNILNLLDWLAGHEVHRFRYMLTGFLTMVDIGIFWVLWRRFGKWPAMIFFLNPISIIITGMHNQFDNFGVFIGMLAMIRFGDDFERPLDSRKYFALVLLGLSLMTKHVLFMFPLWLAVKQRGLVQKILVLGMPVLCFLLGFVPYWTGGSTGILQNVFRYSSTETATHYFHSLFVPSILQSYLSPKIVWGVILVALAFVCRKRSSLESLLIYLAAMVTCAPATTNEYLAIPASFAAVELNPFSIGYFLVGTLQLSLATSALNLLNSPAGFTYNYLDLAIIALTFALAWALVKPHFSSIREKWRAAFSSSNRRT
jgi:hypothetical protein